MPTTVNGIGTRYVGKKGIESFPGVCQSCGRQGTLQNYETGLWFSVIYIPLLPLGKKQILNYCTSCSRHHALDWSEWEKLKDQAVRRDMEAMSQQPDDYAAALKFFTTLVGFRKQAEAADLASLLQNRFGNQADVQMELGSWHESLGRGEQALGCFRKALELAPDSLRAKRAVAFCLIRERRLDEAIRVLESSPPLTPGHDPSLYVMLGRGFQDQHQHDEALQWFSQVLEAAPQAGHEKDFRKLVRTSEKRTNQAASMLPHIAFYRSPAFLITTAVLMIAALAGWGNYYISQHRTLHVVNGLSVPIDVRVDGGAPVKVGPTGRTIVELAEGSHQATISAGGKELDKVDFALNAGFFGRFSKKPVYVLNAAGSAVVAWQKTTYVKNPAPQPLMQDELRMHYGEDFITYDDVDFVFQQFPDQIRIKASSTITRTRVDVLWGIEPAQFFSITDGAHDSKHRMQYIEAHLKASPNERALLRSYSKGCARRNEIDHGCEFLTRLLADRPVLIELHRAYQDLCELAGKDSELVATYQKWLAKEPNSSGLMYLLGRIEPESAEAMKLYDQALAVDPTNRYAWFGKGCQLELMGDFAAARQAVQKACDLAPDDKEMREALIGLQLALGECNDVEKKLRTDLVSDPINLTTYLMLQECIYIQRKEAAERWPLEKTFKRAVSNTRDEQLRGESQQTLLTFAEAEVFYFSGLYKPMLDTLWAAADQERMKMLFFRAFLEQGLFDKAAQFRAQGLPPGYASLLISIGWAQQGDMERSNQWKATAISEMEQGSANDRYVAGMLKDVANLRVDDALHLTIQRHLKAIVLVAFAQHSAAERARLIELAKKLNYRRTFPHNILERTIAGLKVNK